MARPHTYVAFALCDALLPKVVAVTKGGSLDIPLKDFFAQLPAHAKLRSYFDRFWDRSLAAFKAAAEDNGAGGSTDDRTR